MNLASMILALYNPANVGIYARRVVNRLIILPLSSCDGIKQSSDTPLNDQKSLKILHPIVLRQYCRNTIEVIHRSDKFARRYAYEFGSGTSSVGMDPHTFVTHKMITEIDYIISQLHQLLRSNLQYYNLECIDSNQKFNYYSAICITLEMVFEKVFCWVCIKTVCTRIL